MIRTTLTAAALGALTASGAAALSIDNVTPDVIFGSGNVNGSFTVDQGSGVELGLRGKLRFNASNDAENTFNSDGAGTYTFNAGNAPSGFGFDSGSPTTPVWSFEWSVNSNFDGSSGSVLSDLTYELRLDGDPTVGTNFAVFDPINVSVADHAIGTNATGNGGGATAGDPTAYGNLIDGNNVAQNSWNYEFFNETTDGVFLSELSGFNPNVAGTYTIELEAFGSNGASLASTGIEIAVAPVPLPAGGILLLTALGGLGGAGALRRRRRAG